MLRIIIIIIPLRYCYKLFHIGNVIIELFRFMLLIETSKVCDKSYNTLNIFHCKKEPCQFIVFYKINIENRNFFLTRRITIYLGTKENRFVFFFCFGNNTVGEMLKYKIFLFNWTCCL